MKNGAPVLTMDRVSKKFKKGEIYDSLRDLIPAVTGRLFRKRPPTDALDDREFWALRDVSFEVHRGEAFGIIGHNGAGKSTILKLLSRIMEPTTGTVRVDGTLSALIEVGAGFHPDLTGRENIYLNGTILGMRRDEIRRKFDEIVEFSGLADFIDTPVKRYSSGMYARLGFSVAAHVEPDLLIVDEVLSVGDYLFQRKCVEKMTEVIRSGATVVFVSHNLRAVTELCDRSMLLERGRVVKIGRTEEVVEGYLTRAHAQAGGGGGAGKDVYISNVTVRGDDGRVVDFESGQRIWVDVEVCANARVERLAVVLEVKDDDHYEIFHTSTERLGHGSFSLGPGDRYRCTIGLDLHLAQGAFSLGVVLYRHDIQREFDRYFPPPTLFVRADRDVRGAVNLYPTVRSQEIDRGGAALTPATPLSA